MLILQLIALLGLATYRVVRFTQRDTLITTPRIWVQTMLLQHRGAWLSHLLFECPYCLSVWVAGGAVAITDAYTTVPLPVFTWLAVSSASLAAWRYIED